MDHSTRTIDYGMTEDSEELFERLAGAQVESPAIDWVMAYETRHGRNPVDRRHERAFPGDLDSPPRVIEVKAAARGYRGSFLWLEPVQHKHALDDPTFYVYVVENVGQGNPAKFTLRVLAGEQLKRLAANAKERRYYELGWPTKDYDVTPIEATPIVGAIATPVAEVAMTPPAPSNDMPAIPHGDAATAADAVREALTAMGGEGTIAEVNGWLGRHYPGRWKDVGTLMADLTYPGNASSVIPVDRRFLERVSPGRYRLCG